MPKYKVSYDQLWLAIAAGIAIVVGFVVIVGRNGYNQHEGFDSSKGCPTLVTRDPSNNDILVQPGNSSYKTVAEYASAMLGLVKSNPSCVVMRVPDAGPAVGGFNSTGSTQGGLTGGYSAADIAAKQQARRDGAKADAVASANGIKTRAFSTSPIDDVYDYEDDTSAIVQSKENTGNGHGQEMFDQLDKRMRDWSSYPPSATEFESGRTTFTSEQAKSQASGAMSAPNGVVSNTYKAMDGQSVLPPDEDRLEAQERASLSEYGPRTTPADWETPLTEIQAMVDERNKNGTFDETVVRTGPNQFRISKITPKANSADISNLRTSDTTVAMPAQWGSGGPGDMPYLPTPEVKVADPAFDRNNAQSTGSVATWSDYMKWTPGLERAFAPSSPEETWY